jgi:hypothetical protein
LHFLQGGWLCDRSGSYDMVWWPGAALGVMAACHAIEPIKNFWSIGLFLDVSAGILHLGLS